MRIRFESDIAFCLQMFSVFKDLAAVHVICTLQEDSFLRALHSWETDKRCPESRAETSVQINASRVYDPPEPDCLQQIVILYSFFSKIL